MNNVKNYGVHHAQALVGHGFFLKIGLKDGCVADFYSRGLMKLVNDALSWQGKALWARINDSEGCVVISAQTMDRLWAAVAGRYGVASKEAPFVIRGPTLNPSHVVWYYSLDLFGAVNFTTDWFNNGYDDPYWVTICGPNGRVILGNRELERMYHAEVRGRGASITVMLVRPSDDISISGNCAVRSSVILSEHRVV